VCNKLIEMTSLCTASMEVVCNTKLVEAEDVTEHAALPCNLSHLLKLLAYLSINNLYVVHITSSQLTVEISA